MSYTLAQSAKGTTNGKATTVVVTLTGPITAGDYLSLGAWLYQPTGFSLVVSDTASNAWELIDSNLKSTEGLWAYQCVANSTVSSLTVTIEAINGGVATAAFMVGSLIDFATTATPSVTGFATNYDISGHSSALSAGNIPIINSVNLIVVWGSSNTNSQVWTPGSGFTVAESYPGIAAVTLPMCHAYRTGVSSSINPGLSTSLPGNWSCIGAAILDYETAGIQSVTPAAVQSSNSVPFTLTITGFQTNFTSGSVVSIQNSVSGTTTVVAGTWTALSTTSATLAVTTGVGLGTFTVTVDGYVSAPLSTSLQPFIINALITSNGLLAFIFTTSTPAGNGAYPFQALTAINATPTIMVNGSPVTLGPAVGTLSTPDAALVMYRPATPITSGETVTYSLATGGFVTALGSSLQIQNAPVSNQFSATFDSTSLETSVGTWQGFQITPTMQVGGNYGSEPSSPPTTWLPAANALLGSGYQNNNSWRYLGGAVPGGYDTNGYPISWPLGGTITTQLQTGGPPDGVTGAALPVQMGTWTVLLNDPANDKTFAFTGNANVTISAPVKTTLADGRTQITSQINYVASPASLGPALGLAMTSISGRYKPGNVDPKIWVLAPGDVGRIDQSNPFAPSALAVARFKTTSGKAAASVRAMDWQSFGAATNYVLSTDLLNPNAATWFSSQTYTAPGTWSIQRWDTTSGGTPNIYGPTGGIFVDGPDSFGSYCPLSPSDNGQVAKTPTGNNNQWSVWQLKNSVPHGLQHGRSLASSGTTHTTLTLSGVQTFALTQAAYSAITGDVTYTGTISDGASNYLAGVSVTVTGFTNAGNNGTFTVISSTATTLIVSNASGANETHAASVAMQVPFTLGPAYLSGSSIWVTDAYTIGVAAYCGGYAPSSTVPLTIEVGAGPYAVDWTFTQAFPYNNASVPYNALPYLCSAISSATAVYINLPSFGSAACQAAVAQQSAPGLAYGATVYLELGDEAWNNGLPLHAECAGQGWAIQYELLGKVLYNGYYTITSVNKGQLLNWETAYVLMAATAMDAFKAEMTILRPDVTVKCLIGSSWSSPTTTTAICQAIVAVKLQNYFYGLVLAPYMSSSTDASIIAAFSGNWPVPQLNDWNRFYLNTSTIEQGFFSGHAGAITTAGLNLAMVAYEYAENYPVPSSLSGSYYSQLAHDMMAHPSAYQLHRCINLTLQAGSVGVPGSGFVLAHYFNVLYAPVVAGTPGKGQYFLAAGLVQPPGYGLTNQYATAQGGAPANGQAHYLTNQAVLLQAWHDWIDATSPTPPPPVQVRLDPWRTTVATVPVGWQP